MMRKFKCNAASSLIMFFDIKSVFCLFKEEIKSSKKLEEIKIKKKRLQKQLVHVPVSSLSAKVFLYALRVWVNSCVHTM